MGAGILKPVPSGPHSRARRSVFASCALFVVVSTIASLSLAGCGQGAAVNSYIDMSGQILADINAKAGEMKKLWTMPIADQGEMQKALTNYREAISKAQEKLDETKIPQECTDLEQQVAQALDNGRDLSDLTAPFADYLESIAPSANLATAIVSELEALQKENDVSSGLAGLTAKAQQLQTDLRMVEVPAVFTGMQKEFEDFVQSMVSTLASASGQASAVYNTPSSGDTNTDTQNTEQSQASQPSTRKHRSSSSLDGLPDDWTSFNGQLGADLEAARQVTGLTAKNSEIEATIGKALADIKELQKKFK